MGKFFDAMQRAAEVKNVPESTPEVCGASLPALDDTLLQPEEPEAAVSRAPQELQSPTQRQPLEFSETPSGVIRVLESEVQPAVRAETPKRQLQVDPPQAQIHVVDLQSLKEPSLRTQPIQVAQAIREPVATVVRVHPAYDRIVQRLLTYRRTPRQGVILVTGSVAREGTSTVARNVATAMSQSGTEQVLLVDANLRTPSQHEAFQLKRAEGLSEVLKSELSLAAAIHDDVGSGISVMTSGSPVTSPSQVLKATAVQGTIMALLSLYDWIILDSPPATAYPDVSSLGTACGGAILVVRAEVTRSEVAQEAKVVLESTGVDVLGAVLNRRRFHIPQSIYRRL